MKKPVFQSVQLEIWKALAAGQIVCLYKNRPRKLLSWTFCKCQGTKTLQKCECGRFMAGQGNSSWSWTKVYDRVKVFGVVFSLRDFLIAVLRGETCHIHWGPNMLRGVHTSVSEAWSLLYLWAMQFSHACLTPLHNCSECTVWHLWRSFLDNWAWGMMADMSH